MPIIYIPDTPTPASRWFYPDRVRCLECRRFFGPLVIKRLWCSYECAKMPPPSRDPADWPREHRRANGEPKVSYTHSGQVDESNHRRDTIHFYLCGYCGTYHLGHRVVSDVG